MDNAPSTLVTALIEAGNIDTVYRDVYLDRARTLLAPVLPLDEFHRLEQQRATLAELSPTIARALDKGSWTLVKDLSERGEALKRALEDKSSLLGIARSVYDARDVRLDPFSPGLQPFTRIAAHELPTLRTRVLDLLGTLTAADAAWKDFYEVRQRAFQAAPATASDILEPGANTSAATDALEAARQALKAGDMKRVAALADVLITGDTPGKAVSSHATNGESAPGTEPGRELQPAPYSSETLARARHLGLAPRHVEPRLDLAYLRRYAWTPLSEVSGRTAVERVPLPAASPEGLQDLVAMFTIHPLVNSGGARHLPHLVAEDVLLEDFPDPADGETPPASELVKRLNLPGRRGLPRVAIEQALLMHGAGVLADGLGLDPRVFRLVCIPSDIYARVGEAEGWGRQPFWTHFDGYLVMADGRLRALAGGDARFGGLYELLGVGRDYDSDRLLARFAVVQRARMAAW